MTWLPFALSALLLPLVFVCIDVAGGVKSRWAEHQPVSGSPCGDFELIVPLWGALRYLENVEYLASYGPKVLICTTAGETPEFYAGLEELSRTYGFRVFSAPVESSSTAAGRRDTGGTVRDRIVREAVHHVRMPYVVFVDADTVTERPFDDLVGTMVDRGFDMVSVRLAPANTERWLGKFQAHEYRIAMSLRRIAPWLISGGCHASRTSVHRDVMARHSMFYQGNDVETGVLGLALGYTVGHVEFDVPTRVPDTCRAWLRQRLAWSGGEVRLFLVNLPLLRRHPFMWIYGALITIAAFPLRWAALRNPGWILLAVVIAYLGFVLLLHWRTRDRWVFLLPLYSAFNSLVVTPLGILWYLRMATQARNVGRIDPERPAHVPMAVVR